LYVEFGDKYVYKDKVYIIVYGMSNYGSSEHIRTDFINLRAYDKKANYPTNSQLDINDDGSKEWTVMGVLDTTATFMGFNFQNALQMAVLNEIDDNVVIPLGWSSETRGRFRISNINISYKINTPPVIEIIPSPIQVEEDMGSYNTRIDISDFILDDSGFNKLTIEVHKGGEETVTATFNENNELILTPAENFFGDVFLNLHSL